jgi:predicted RNA-binding Zn-ribbon protein involved in translation (DUF1610 family)
MVWDEVLGTAGMVRGRVTYWNEEQGWASVADGQGTEWLAERDQLPDGRTRLAVGTRVLFTGAPVPLHELGARLVTSLKVVEVELPTCQGCDVEAGEEHGEECVQARCPECGEQRLGRCAHDPDQPALWHGVDPLTEVAREQGWWLREQGEPAVEDHPRAKEAVRRGYVVWHSQAQRYRQAPRITAVEVPTALLTEALWAGAEGRLGVVAAVQMLAQAGRWLDRTDFRSGYVDYEPEELAGAGAGTARVDWMGVAVALSDGSLQAEMADVAVMLLAASLGGGGEVDLQRALIEVRKSPFALEVRDALMTAIS